MIVRVVRAVDRDIYDVSAHVGRLGLVESQDGRAGGEPMTIIRFGDRTREAFWPEEIEQVRA